MPTHILRPAFSWRLLCVIALLPPMWRTAPTLAAEAPAAAAENAPTLPFTLEVVEVPDSAMPAIHSFCSASADGKWLLLCGRIGGLHGFGPGNDNFPRSTANTKAYVIDPGANRLVGSIDLVAHLPPHLAGPLTATNSEFTQVGGDLFIVGGYGQDLKTQSITTFGTITKVNVPALIKAIAAPGTPIARCFTQGPPDNRLKVTGGGLKAWKGTFFLVFGQDFSGRYSVQNRDYNRAGGQFQKYTEKVRVFTLNADLSINTFDEIDGGYDPDLPYHRRDLNLVDVIEADSMTPAATLYGGVFKAGQVAGHVMPIDLAYASAPAALAVRSGFKQAMNIYDCANVTIFDKASASSFTSFFGGISQYRYERDSNTLVQDAIDLARGVDGLPFTDTVTTIQRQPAGVAFAQFIHPDIHPGLIGTDAQFLGHPALRKAGQVFDNGVIDLARLNRRTLVGHLVGGIESKGPYSGLITSPPSTVASRRLFEVWISPEPSQVISMPPLPLMPTPYPSTKASTRLPDSAAAKISRSDGHRRCCPWPRDRSALIITRIFRTIRQAR
ncbi:MAG TPA: hypothetical protein VG826_33130 [Pirellulales bacterium]|nr:hypothetical protein [Pirellulales bacterium]